MFFFPNWLRADACAVLAGLYDLPKFNPDLEAELTPDLHNAAQAVARRQRWRIIPEGAWAANVLGLSTQVPSKITYLIDGPKHQIAVGRRMIFFKHARPKHSPGQERSFRLSFKPCGIWKTGRRDARD